MMPCRLLIKLMSCKIVKDVVMKLSETCQGLCHRVVMLLYTFTQDDK